ncbi:MAG TPA: flagellar biosynthetic protein FliR [Kofleriaceae bacterium]|nr:flagellar biosynthetic protein FliR [Kofleriaceae bacterium]
MSAVVDPWALVLALARVAPLVLVAPALGGIPLPRVAQAALALVVASVVASGLAVPAATLAGAGWVERIALLGREVMIGATLGVVAAVPLLAAAAAGAWASASSGSDDAGVGTWSWFFPITAAMVFFAVGGHLAVIGALGMSYRALPAAGAGAGGGAVSAGDALAVVVGAGSQMIAAGLALAAPLVVASMLAAVLVGVVERAAGLPVELVPEPAVRRAVVVLAAAAALVAIAMVIAGDARALPTSLAAAVDRLAPIR